MGAGATWQRIFRPLILVGNPLTLIGCVGLLLGASGLMDAEMFAIGISSGVRVIASVCGVGTLARRCDVRTQYASHLASCAVLHLDLFEWPTRERIW